MTVETFDRTSRSTEQLTGQWEGQERPSNRRRLEGLRRQVRLLERGDGDTGRGVAPLGAVALDERLPGGGLATTGLHEILPARSEWDDGAASGFTLALLGRLMVRREGPILWAARQADLYAPALAGFGVAAERLLLARTGKDGDTLWALEEGLRCPDLAAVVGEVGDFDPTAARRLQLAAETIGRPCLLLQRQRLAPRHARAASPALTRWRIEARAGNRKQAGTEGLPRNLVGNPVWRVELLRCRGGRPAIFEVEWDHATSDFALAAELCDSTPAAFG